MIMKMSRRDRILVRWRGWISISSHVQAIVPLASCQTSAFAQLFTLGAWSEVEPRFISASKIGSVDKRWRRVIPGLDVTVLGQSLLYAEFQTELRSPCPGTRLDKLNTSHFSGDWAETWINWGKPRPLIYFYKSTLITSNHLNNFKFTIITQS